MKEYHPPMTGLESEFETELHPKEQQQEAKNFSEEQSKASRETPDDRSTEESMNLGR